MARKYLPPSTAKAKGIHIPAPAEPEKPTEPQAPAGDQGKGEGAETTLTVPAESETRDTLEAFAVEHAGLTENDVKAYANKGDLRAAIVAALEQAKDDESE